MLTRTVGVLFSENSTGTARKNKVENNGKSGFVIQGKANPVIEENQCNKNKSVGIIFIDTE